MAKECKFYYAVVGASDMHYPAVNDQVLEPIRREGHNALGKEPEFCCETIKKIFQMHPYYTNGHGFWMVTNDSPYQVEIKYCSFCGAQIIFVRDLTVKATKFIETKPREYYVYQVMK
jgi:hypothetical protein